MSHPRPRWPQPKDVPSYRALLQAFEGIPLEHVLSAFASYPLRHCPRWSCASDRAKVIGERFMCPSCGLMGGGAAFAGGALYDFTFDQVAEVLDLERVGREEPSIARAADYVHGPGEDVDEATDPGRSKQISGG